LPCWLPLFPDFAIAIFEGTSGEENQFGEGAIPGIRKRRWVTCVRELSRRWTAKASWDVRMEKISRKRDKIKSGQGMPDSQRSSAW
jgi:hypothetical protein